MNILRLKDVNKYYKLGNGEKLHVLKDINLEFNTGELVSIIGESGSGKSTLMNVIGGLDKDYSGEIVFEDKDLKTYKEIDLDRYRKDRIGFVFQSFNLIPHLSVLDNVTIPCILSNLNKKEREIKAKDILTKLGLKAQINKKPNKLSGGEKQRVAIARALINEPQIIIADEPTGALDSATSKQILNILTDIAKESKLVIMVTHSEAVASISSRIVKIHDGGIVEDYIKEENSICVKEEIKKEASNKKYKQNLSFISSVKLALKNMKEKFLRNFLVALGSSIGIMSIIVMLSIGTGIEKYIVDKLNGYTNPNIIEVNQKAEDANLKTDNSPSMQSPINMVNKETKSFSSDDISKLEKISGVTKSEKAFSAFMITTNTIKFEDSKTIIQLLSTTSSYLLQENVKYGKMPIQNQVMISNSVAKRFGQNKDIKDIAELINKECTINIQAKDKIITKNVTISGIYGDDSPGITGNMTGAYLTYDYLSSLYTEINKDLNPSTIYLTVDNQKNVDTIKKEVITLGFEGSRQEAIIGTFTQMLDIMKYILTAIAGISLLVSSIMILVVLYISVIERTNEIGVLKAIGARRKDIKRIFFAESFLVGLFGGLFGIANALGLITIISIIVERQFGLNNIVVLSPIDSLFALGVSILVSVIAGLYPSAKAAKLDPIDSLRHE